MQAACDWMLSKLADRRIRGKTATRDGNTKCQQTFAGVKKRTNETIRTTAHKQSTCSNLYIIGLRRKLQKVDR